MSNVRQNNELEVPGRGNAVRRGRLRPDQFGRVLNVVEAAEMLELVHTPKRRAVLDPLG